MVFCRLCGFLTSLWFFDELVVFAVFVVFCRACGFLTSLWFFDELVVFVELVDLCSTVVINGKQQRDLTTESMLC